MGDKRIGRMREKHSYAEDIFHNSRERTRMPLRKLTHMPIFV